MREMILPIEDRKFTVEVENKESTLPQRKYKEVRRQIEFIVTKK